MDTIPTCKEEAIFIYSQEKKREHISGYQIVIKIMENNLINFQRFNRFVPSSVAK